MIIYELFDNGNYANIEKSFDYGHLLKVWPKGFTNGLDVDERHSEK